MNVLFGTLTKIDEYKMTSQSAKKLSFKETAGQVIKVVKACTYETITKEGNAKSILSVMTDNGVVISGDSKTALDSFNEIVGIFGDELKDLDLTIVAEESKNGRTFISIQVV